jgi:quinol monooxygenase YgiN
MGNQPRSLPVTEQRMTNLTVVAKITAKSGMTEYVQTELRKLIEPTYSKDAGCISYVLYQDQNDPSVFFFLETWESEELLNRHIDSEHFKAFTMATEGKVERSIVHLLKKSV